MGKWKIKKTKDQFVEEAIKKHGDKYDYSMVVYVTGRTKVEIICKEHGVFLQEPANHINGSGCPACVGCKRVSKETFVERSRSTHGDRYDYSKTAFTNVDAKVTITCSEHGDFEQVAYDHMKGRGCAKCGADKAVNLRRHSLDRFISEARKFHGDRFDYSKAIYINSTTPIEIICQEHGSFWQVPQDHKTRYGCQSCAGLSPISADEFLARAIATHGDTYRYDIESYDGWQNPVTIICKKHGYFEQTPKSHINRSSRCPRCVSAQTASREETEIADWLKTIITDVDRNNRDVLDGFEIDIYLPSIGIGIEYNGSYWHHDERMTHPRLHETKSKRAEKKGVRLITVWDFDWKNRPDLIRRHILHAIGKSNDQRVGARDCTVSQISFDQARPFFEQNHVQGAPWRALCHYGLFHDEKMVACMSFGQGNSRRGKTGDEEWELLRFATSCIVRGGASKLFSAFINDQSPAAVWSFSDRQHFGGGVYTTLGFIKDGDVPADYRVAHINKGIVWHKSAWKRRHIPARLSELCINDQFDPDTDPRTERDMQAIAGTVRIMDSGKIRWKWGKKRPDEPGAF